MCNGRACAYIGVIILGVAWIFLQVVLIGFPKHETVGDSCVQDTGALHIGLLTWMGVFGVSSAWLIIHALVLLCCDGFNIPRPPEGPRPTSGARSSYARNREYCYAVTERWIWFILYVFQWAWLFVQSAVNSRALINCEKHFIESIAAVLWGLQFVSLLCLIGMCEILLSHFQAASTARVGRDAPQYSVIANV